MKKEVKDIFHPIEKQWIKKDGVVTEFGKQYYASIARDIADKRKARKLDIAKKYYGDT